MKKIGRDKESESARGTDRLRTKLPEPCPDRNCKATTSAPVQFQRRCTSQVARRRPDDIKLKQWQWLMHASAKFLSRRR